MIEQKNVPGVYPAALLAHSSASAWVSRLSSDLAMHSLNSPCSSYSFIQAQAGLYQQTGICVCEKERVRLCQFLNSFVNHSKFWFLTSIYSKCIIIRKFNGCHFERASLNFIYSIIGKLFFQTHTHACTMAAEQSEFPRKIKPLTFNFTLTCCYSTPLWMILFIPMSWAGIVTQFTF